MENETEIIEKPCFRSHLVHILPQTDLLECVKQFHVTITNAFENFAAEGLILIY